MNTAIEQMLKNYQIENIYDQKNAMKEIMQEIVLCGLSRAFFSESSLLWGNGTPNFLWDVRFRNRGICCMKDLIPLIFARKNRMETVG